MTLLLPRWPRLSLVKREEWLLALVLAALLSFLSDCEWRSCSGEAEATWSELPPGRALVGMPVVYLLEFSNFYLSDFSTTKFLAVGSSVSVARSGRGLGPLEAAASTSRLALWWPPRQPGPEKRNWWRAA